MGLLNAHSFTSFVLTFLYTTKAPFQTKNERKFVLYFLLMGTYIECMPIKCIVCCETSFHGELGFIRSDSFHC